MHKIVKYMFLGSDYFCIVHVDVLSCLEIFSLQLKRKFGVVRFINFYMEQIC